MFSDYKEREKLSWSEIDKRKDRSRHTNAREEQYRDRKNQKDFAMGKYKQALENLFTPGKKLSKSEAKQLKKIRETSDRSEFMELADVYIEEHGLPNAWDDLENFLRHKDAQVLSETIRRMETLLEEQSDTRRGNFQKDLHLIEMTTRDKELRKQVSALLKNLEP